MSNWHFETHLRNPCELVEGVCSPKLSGGARGEKGWREGRERGEKNRAMGKAADPGGWSAA